MDLRPGATLEGPSGQTITIETFIGSGGFGQVFRGVLPDGTRVAVKTVLTASLTDSELRALQNEAKLAAKVDHPNVVRLLHVNDGATGSGLPPYLVMEYVDGDPLRRLIVDRQARRDPLQVAEVRLLFEQIAAGMEAVNEKVVHRDLKPENILVDKVNGELKITDFGLAKLADAATRTATFKGAGTLPYMAPEAFEALPNTVAMDIYSAGVLFHEIAALDLPVVPPQGLQGPAGWRHAHLLTPPANLRVLRPDLPADVVQLVMRMLEKDPKKRPAWKEIRERLAVGAAPADGGPDVAVLVEQATARHQREGEAQARAREETERAELRTAVLHLAFREPVEILRTVVDAFNRRTAIGGLTISESSPLSVSVSGPTRQTLAMAGQLVEDLDIQSFGVVRIVASVQVTLGPTAREAQDAGYDPNSFGGFNLVYRVASPAERYGTWSQLRFEFSPLYPLRRSIRWLHIGLAELPRQLQLLRAVGQYQHEQQQLDDVWFRELLVHIV